MASQFISRVIATAWMKGIPIWQTMTSSMTNVAFCILPAFKDVEKINMKKHQLKSQKTATAVAETVTFDGMLPIWAYLLLNFAMNVLKWFSQGHVIFTFIEGEIASCWGLCISVLWLFYLLDSPLEFYNPDMNFLIRLSICTQELAKWSKLLAHKVSCKDFIDFDVANLLSEPEHFKTRAAHFPV